jgi:metal transporter CNNM
MSSDMGYSATRPLALAFAKALLFLYRLQPANAIPLTSIFELPKGDVSNSSGDPSLWLYLGVAVVLVLLGGAFAGLTIA